MKRPLYLIFVFIVAAWLSGCAQVPMAPSVQDQVKKKFDPPSKGMSGIYIYRNSSFGGALLKSVYIDGNYLGETGPNVYFYTEVKPGMHAFSTESEFSENHLKLTTMADKLYFLRQYIKMGLFVGGANFEVMPEAEGKSGVMECKLALPGKSQSKDQAQHIAVPHE
jgi:hypothetical protein